MYYAGVSLPFLAAAPFHTLNNGAFQLESANQSPWDVRHVPRCFLLFSSFDASPGHRSVFSVSFWVCRGPSARRAGDVRFVLFSVQAVLYPLELRVVSFLRHPSGRNQNHKAHTQESRALKVPRRQERPHTTVIITVWMPPSPLKRKQTLPPQSNIALDNVALSFFPDKRESS